MGEYEKECKELIDQNMIIKDEIKGWKDKV